MGKRETIPWLFIAWIPLAISYPDIAGDCDGPGGPHIPNNPLSKNLDYKVTIAKLVVPAEF